MRKNIPSKKDTRPPEGASAVLARMRENGVTVKAWADAHGFSKYTVTDVLRGHRKGLRGEAHRVAVALGLKKGKVTDPRQLVFVQKDGAGA